MADQLSESEFVRLLTAHEVRLRALALSLIPNWTDAEEVLQDANVVIWRKHREFTPGTNFFAWTARIVQLTALDFRKRARDRRVVFDDAVLDAIATEMVATHSEISDRERFLSECISKLKPRAQELLRMKYQQGCSTEEVATNTSTTVGAVYDALGRAYKTLLECVERKLFAREIG